jgi:hypothetical protein
LYLDCQKEILNIEKAQQLIETLPFFHRVLAKEIFSLFFTISCAKNLTKMSPSNLAVTNGPGLLFRSNSVDPAQELSNMNRVRLLISQMIEHHCILFGELKFEEAHAEVKYDNC